MIMGQYISKAAVVAEIERLKKEDGNPYFPSETADQYYARGVHFTCDRLVNFLGTLEVKDVDDEKCKEYDKALSIAKSWYISSDSSAQERNVARMIMGDKVREEL